MSADAAEEHLVKNTPEQKFTVTEVTENNWEALNYTETSHYAKVTLCLPLFVTAACWTSKQHLMTSQISPISYYNTVCNDISTCWSAGTLSIQTVDLNDIEAQWSYIMQPLTAIIIEVQDKSLLITLLSYLDHKVTSWKDKCNKQTSCLFVLSHRSVYWTC